MEPEFENLIQNCCARVEVAGTSGTAFFVGSNLLVTARHVVAGALQPGGVRLIWQGNLIPAEVIKSSERIDSALLRIRGQVGLPLDHPCILMAPEVQVGDPCYAFGFSDLVSTGEPLTVEVEGTTPDGDLKIKHGQIRPGFSGAPLLNRRTGAVCGLIRSTRGRESDLGGRAVTAASILGEFQELVDIQRRVHAADSRWEDSWRAERRRRQREAGGRGVSILLHLATIGAAIALVRMTLEPARAIAGPRGWLLAAAVGVVPALVLAITETTPLLAALARQRSLARRANKSAERPHSYFRVGPYENTPEDISSYRRDDRLHHAVLEWLRGPLPPVAYITGLSGTGKSSLIKAYAIPGLQSSTDVDTVLVRSGANPGIGLLRALGDRGQAADPISAVRAICAAEPRKRFLFIFDQFEEFVIVNDASSEVVRSFLTFIGEFVDSGLRNAVVLLVLRSDYLGALEHLGFPPLRQSENWKEVAPFTERDAAAFLERSGLGLSEQSLDKIVEQLAHLEDTPGLVRPITLNMIGVVLSRLGKQRTLLAGKVSRLLIGYVRSCVLSPPVRSHASKVLRRMLTDVGTRIPVPVSRLARETGFDARVVTGCLLSLSGSGLVRRVDDETDTWEISHDFVASLLVPVLAGLSSSLSRRIRPWLAPLALMLWFLAAALAVSQWREDQAFLIVGSNGGNLQKVADGIKVYFDDSSENIDSALATLSDLENVTELDIGSTRFTSAGFLNLKRLEQLRVLELYSSPVTDGDLEALASLRDLSRLNLTDTKITMAGLRHLSGLGSLQSLILTRTRPRGCRETLRSLPALRELMLSATDIRDEDLAGLVNHPSLERIELINTRVSNRGVMILASAPRLRALRLDDTDVTDTGLAAFKSSRSLREIDLYNTAAGDSTLAHLPPGMTVLGLTKTQITDDGLIRYIKRFPNLTELYVKDTQIGDAGMTPLPALRRLKVLSVPITRVTNAGMQTIAEISTLEKLFAGGLEGVTDAGVPPLCSLPNLTLLYLPGTKITNSALPCIADMPKLTELSIGETGVQPDAVERLRQQRPSLIVHYE